MESLIQAIAANTEPGRNLLLGGAIVIAALTFLSLYRSIVGPRSVDRLVAVNVITTKTILLMALVAHISRQYSFLDIALAYALLGFVTTVLVLKATLKGRLF